MNTENSVTKNAQLLLQKMQRKSESRVEANCKTIADVDWGDLEHFLDNARRKKDAESFDTAIRILTAIKNQVLDIK